LRSAPLDPDRDERQAWMGDPAKDAESEAFNFDVAAFYTKWMDDVRGSQRSDGAIPSVAMYWLGGDNVEWPSVFTIIPDWFMDFYDDSRVARNNYESMKEWVLAMRRHELPDGTLRSTGYADWCDTSTMDGKVPERGSTPHDLVSSAYQYHNDRIMERLARRFGKPGDATEFAGLAGQLKPAFNKRFLDSNTHMYQGDTQCGYVLALQFGLVPEDQRVAVSSNLVDNILVKHNGHLSVGLIGIQWLMQTLTDIGRPDVAWTIATQTNRPSWGYMLSKGATSIWERWDMDTRDPGMNSEALLIQAGNLDAWFYQTLAGINCDPQHPGFKHIIIRPHLLGDLTWVKAHFDSPFGRISSEWKLNGDELTMNVTIPPNTTATIYVPGKTSNPSNPVTEVGKPAGVGGLKPIRVGNGVAVFEAAAGSYEFNSVR
jgi:alpha-L-rhamnosidase